MTWVAELPVQSRNGQWIDLADLLAVMPENNLIWSLIDFYGVGVVPPRGLEMAEFEELVRATPGGLRHTWPALKQFADDLEQTYECLIVGVCSEEDIVPAQLEQDNFERCAVVIQAHDSTKWVICVNADAEWPEKLRTRLEGLS
jgi:hypothetical protein